MRGEHKYKYCALTMAAQAQESKPEAAWEGPDSLAGEAVASAGVTFATQACYWGRSYPLRLLDPNIDPAFINYTILLYPCPRYFWGKYFATILLFCAIDELFTGYVSPWPPDRATPVSSSGG